MLTAMGTGKGHRPLNSHYIWNRQSVLHNVTYMSTHGMPSLLKQLSVICMWRMPPNKYFHAAVN